LPFGYGKALSITKFTLSENVRIDYSVWPILWELDRVVSHFYKDLNQVHDKRVSHLFTLLQTIAHCLI